MILKSNQIVFQKVIYLPLNIKKLLDSNKVSLDNLNEDILSATDMTNIRTITESKISEGLFEYFGFKNPIVVIRKDNEKYCSCECPVREYQDLSIIASNFTATTFDAFFTADKKLILWETECSCTTISNNMFKGNLERILKAMTRVMSFEEVINSEQMEQYVLAPTY